MPLKKQVMIVDEDKASRDALRSILSAQYRVLEAESGIEAVPFLSDQRNEVSLILMDIMIRGANGADFLDQIMRDPEMALIPVIVTTKEPNKVEEGDVLDRGAAGYVSEPYNPKIVRSRVARLISLRENAAIANYYRCDQLTGLYSKELFYQKAQRRIQAYPDREYTVICSNVENFKLFNDVFGHSEGDRLLKKIAGALQKLAGTAGICGRLGSDRFLMLLSQERRSRGYSLLVETVDKALKKYSSKIVKWGIYEVTDTTVPVEQMCNRALMAGDSIKGQYTARFAVYDDTLRDKLLWEQRIIGSVETALREKQFTVYLQPKFRLSDDRLAGAEALVRWQHPQMGFLPPGKFIPLLEKKGFITQLDQYVWEQACRMLQEWKARGRKLVPISVNVSRADIYQSEFPNVLLSLVRKYHVDPEMLHLEITESAYAENLEQIIEAVGQLRELGFSIEMDDFGSGYSSLNMLSRIKVDILKLDLKFIQNETVEAGGRGILHLVVELARKMNMRVVAEGVETQEQLRYIREAGCDYVQGYLFAKPMPDTEFEKYLHESESADVVGK